MTTTERFGIMQCFDDVAVTLISLCASYLSLKGHMNLRYGICTLYTHITDISNDIAVEINGTKHIN